MTNYVILEGDDSGHWRPIAEVEHHSADSALLSLKADGFYVAIPKRHWRPRQVKTETVMRSRIAEGEPEVRTAPKPPEAEK